MFYSVESDPTKLYELIKSVEFYSASVKSSEMEVVGLNVFFSDNQPAQVFGNDVVNVFAEEQNVLSVVEMDIRNLKSRM